MTKPGEAEDPVYLARLRVVIAAALFVDDARHALLFPHHHLEALSQTVDDLRRVEREADNGKAQVGDPR